jgi:hypothetical protein
MARMMVKRIGVLSAAKMYSLVGFGIGLIVGVIYGLIIMMFGAAMMMSSTGTSNSGAGAGAGASGFIIGLLIMVGFPILYGVMCFIAGAIGALIYNVAARIAGGIELELENAAPDYAAPPQPQYGGQY